MKLNGMAVPSPIAVQMSAMLISSAIIVGLHLFAGADAAERRHHAQHRAEQAEQRTALDRRGDPVGAIFEVAHHVALQNFGDDLPQLVVAQLAVGDGQRRSAAAVRGHRPPSAPRRAS